MTGSQGFTGTHFIKNASRSGFHCIALNANLLDRNALSVEIEKYDFDHVLHLAAISNPAHTNRSDFYSVNVLGTENLLEALVVRASNLKKIIIPSSATVYGANVSGKLAEHMTLNPVAHYPISKMAMESICRKYFQYLPIIVARPFNYTGVGQMTSFVVPKIVEHFQQARQKIYLGNTFAVREFNDIRDVCEIYIKLLQYGSHGTTVNVCSERGVSIDEILSICVDITGHQLGIEIDANLVRANDPELLLGDSTILNSMIGEHDFKDIKQTLNWMLQGARKCK